MLMRYWTRRARDEERGFTLIELMVVVLIIAILIAIAIPTFLGARRRAQDRAAQSGLRNSLTSAKTIFTDNETYTTATAGALQAAEPSLTFVTGGLDSSGPTTVSVAPGASANVWKAAALSNSGTCFYIRDNTQGPGTEFARKTNAGATCNANEYSDSGAPGGTLLVGWS